MFYQEYKNVLFRGLYDLFPTKVGMSGGPLCFILEKQKTKEVKQMYLMFYLTAQIK